MEHCLISADTLRLVLSGKASIKVGVDSVDNSTLNTAVAETEWRGPSPLKGVISYLAASPEPKVPSITDAKELAPIVASILGLTVVNQATSPKRDTDDTILARLEAEGDYIFTRGGDTACVTSVAPREGNLYLLERKHFHPRDAKIIFEEQAHVYYLLSDEGGPARFQGSVSSAYGRWFSHFDADEVVRKNLDRWVANPNKEYHEITVALSDAIDTLGRNAAESLPDVACSVMAHLWNINNLRERACEKGTAMHLALEQRCNSVPEEEINLIFDDGAVTLPEVQYQHFVKSVVEAEGLRPYRTEWSVYDTHAVLSGQIDSLWIDREGRFHMLDWKRCKNANLGPDEKHWGRYGTGPCATVPDTDYGHYGCQQALYAYILEQNYDIQVASMKLVQFHPTALDIECRVIEIDESFRGVAIAIVKERTDQQRRESVKRAKMA